MKKPKKRMFRISRSLVLVSVLTLLFFGSVRADVKNWVGLASDWNDPGNWSPAGVPVKSDSVFINTTGDLVSYNNPQNPTLKYLEINDPSSVNPSPKLYQDLGTLTTEGTVIGLTGGYSLYDHRGGTHRLVLGSPYRRRSGKRQPKAGSRRRQLWYLRPMERRRFGRRTRKGGGGRRRLPEPDGRRRA